MKQYLFKCDVCYSVFQEKVNAKYDHIFEKINVIARDDVDARKMCEKIIDRHNEEFGMKDLVIHYVLCKEAIEIDSI